MKTKDYLKLPTPSNTRERTSPHDIVPVDYLTNSEGYRCMELNLTTENSILVNGCSFTFGAGLPKEYIFAEELGRLTESEVVNLGYPGKDSATIILDTYKYLKRYPKPKAIFILLPDIERTHGYIDSKDFFDYGESDGVVQVQITLHKNRLKSIHIPFNDDENEAIKKLITPLREIHNTVNSMSLLKDYCDLMGVKMFHGSWDASVQDALSVIPDRVDLSYLEKFLIAGADAYGTELEKKLWLDAADTKGGHPHPGILWHKFFANVFYNAYKESSSP